MKIVIISSDKWKNKCREDKFLMDCLISEGIECEIESWESGVKYNEGDLLILRSPWDYYEKHVEFRKWLCDLRDKHINIANGVSNILVNIDKQRQFLSLLDCEVPLIPFVITDTVDSAIDWYEGKGYQNVVIKPTISASGYGTYLVKSKEELCYKFCDIIKTNRNVIIQPFVESINQGEMSLIYIHGVFSHGVIRYPGVISEKKKAVFLTSIDEEWLEAGNKICRYISAEELLYVRIDLVRFEEQISIMEIELSEPDLYFTLDTTGDKMKRFILEIKKEAYKNTY